MKALRVCPDCGAWTEKKRCDCQRYEKKWNRPRRDGPKYEGSLQAAHHYHFNKTRIQSAMEGRRRRYSRPGVKRGVAWSHAHPRIEWGGQDNKAIAVFMWRTELAYLKNRDEFAGLMRARVALRLQRKSNDEVCEWLDLSRRELAELDGIIVGDGFLRRLPRSHYDGPVPEIPRRMKKGVAADILRRRRMNYKQGQIPTVQLVSPLSR